MRSQGPLSTRSRPCGPSEGRWVVGKDPFDVLLTHWLGQRIEVVVRMGDVSTFGTGPPRDGAVVPGGRRPGASGLVVVMPSMLARQVGDCGRAVRPRGVVVDIASAPPGRCSPARGTFRPARRPGRPWPEWVGSDAWTRPARPRSPDLRRGAATPTRSPWPSAGPAPRERTRGRGISATSWSSPSSVVKETVIVT